MEPYVLEGYYLNARCRWTLLEGEILVEAGRKKRRLPLKRITSVSFTEPKGPLTDGVISLGFDEVAARQEDDPGPGDYMEAFLRTPGISSSSNFRAIRFKRKQLDAAHGFYLLLKERIGQ